MASPTWLVDEMLGRLARYLRFVGCDTAYVRGKDDDELVVLAEREGRVLLTRDRALSQRSSRAFRILSPVLAEQWREVRTRWPSIPVKVRFDRCSLCNGLLTGCAEGYEPPADAGVPVALRRAGRLLYQCRECGHLYWDGSHTSKIQAQIDAWERSRAV